MDHRSREQSVHVLAGCGFEGCSVQQNGATAAEYEDVRFKDFPLILYVIIFVAVYLFLEIAAAITYWDLSLVDRFYAIVIALVATLFILVVTRIPFSGIERRWSLSPGSVRVWTRQMGRVSQEDLLPSNCRIMIGEVTFAPVIGKATLRIAAFLGSHDLDVNQWILVSSEYANKNVKTDQAVLWIRDVMGIVEEELRSGIVVRVR